MTTGFIGFIKTFALISDLFIFLIGKTVVKNGSDTNVFIKYQTRYWLNRQPNHFSFMPDHLFQLNTS